MAFQPAPACAQAVLRFGESGSGKFAYANVLNFVRPNLQAYNESALELLAETLEDWFLDQGDAHMSTVYQLIDIQMRALDSAEAPYYNKPINAAGTVTGDPMPLNVTACLSMTTGLTGRSARGRMYWGGLSEVQVAANSLVAGVVTGLNNMCADLLTRLATDETGTLVVLSRFTGGVARETAHPLPVTSFALRDGILDTQRRRINRLK